MTYGGFRDHPLCFLSRERIFVLQEETEAHVFSRPRPEIRICPLKDGGQMLEQPWLFCDTIRRQEHLNFVAGDQRHTL